MAKFGETKMSEAVLEIIGSVEKTRIKDGEAHKKEFQNEIIKLKESISTEDKDKKEIDKEAGDIVFKLMESVNLEKVLGFPINDKYASW